MRFTWSRTVLCAFVALSPAASAADYFVNARTGDNANSGVTRNRAWRTLSHAVATAPAGTTNTPTIIHVSAGLYDTGHGEVFPLRPRDNVHIVGTEDRRAITVDGGITSEPLIRCAVTPTSSQGQGLLVERITLRRGMHGVLATSTDGPVQVTLRDLRVTLTTSAGYYGEARLGQSPNGVTKGTLDATIQRCGFDRCGTGLAVSSYDAATLAVEDSDVSDNFGDGMTSIANALSSVRIERTRVHANAGVGLFCGGPTAGSGSSTIVRDSAFVANLVGGVSLRSQDINLHAHALFVERCTFASNGGPGIDIGNPLGSNARPTSLIQSIFWGNADDILESPSGPPIQSVVRCDIGDGDYLGVNGTFSADPLFRDQGEGDVRLVFGSPCIDTGDALPPGTFDVEGVERAIDGDLDLVERSDLGAHEFQLLRVANRPRVGGQIVLELAGPAGAPADVLFRRADLMSPQSTPWGEIELAPGYVTVGTTFTLPSPPNTFTIALADIPSLAGKVYSAQLLITTPNAPNGQAFSNAVRIPIAP